MRDRRPVGALALGGLHGPFVSRHITKCVIFPGLGLLGQTGLCCSFCVDGIQGEEAMGSRRMFYGSFGDGLLILRPARLRSCMFPQVYKIPGVWLRAPRLSDGFFH